MANPIDANDAKATDYIHGLPVPGMMAHKDLDPQARLKSDIRPGLGRRVLSHWKKAVGATLIAIGLSQTPAAPIITDIAKTVASDYEGVINTLNQGNPEVQIPDSTPTPTVNTATPPDNGSVAPEF